MGLAAQPETEATRPGEPELAAGSIASGAEGSRRITVPSVEETLRRAQGPDGSLELSLSGMRSQIVPEHRMADEGHGVTDTAQGMIDRAYDAAVASGKYTGVDAFIGGTGSGKSVTSEATPLSAERRTGRIILESHVENAENLAAKIDKARESELPIDLHVVIRDPVESYRSVVGRYGRAEASQPGSGKVVPVNYGAATHEAVIENVPTLMAWYANDPSIRWRFIDNRGMPVEAREVSPEEGLRLLASIDSTDLSSKFNQVLDNAKLTKRDRERFGDQSLPSEFGSAPAQEVETESSRAQEARYGNSNTVFTRERLARAQEAVRRKLNPNRLSAGIDPSVLPHLLTIAGYHLEAGSIKFAEWSSRMVNDVGDWVTPHLPELYKRALQSIYWRSRRPGLSSDKAELLTNILADATNLSRGPLENLVTKEDEELSLGESRPEDVEEEDVLGTSSESLTSGAAGGNEGIMPPGVNESAGEASGKGRQAPEDPFGGTAGRTKKPVSDILAELASRKNYAPTVSGRHHLLPRALGNNLPYGHKALTLIRGEKHAILQGELNVHLRSITKKLLGGKVVDMMPRRGNAGKVVLLNFTLDERIRALDDFYRNFAEGRYYAAFRMELKAARAKGRLQ